MRRSTKLSICIGFLLSLATWSPGLPPPDGTLDIPPSVGTRWTLTCTPADPMGRPCRLHWTVLSADLYDPVFPRWDEARVRPPVLRYAGRNAVYFDLKPQASPIRVNIALLIISRNEDGTDDGRWHRRIVTVVVPGTATPGPGAMRAASRPATTRGAGS